VHCEKVKSEMVVSNPWVGVFSHGLGYFYMVFGINYLMNEHVSS
jgi:hypothetical protein